MKERCKAGDPRRETSTQLAVATNGHQFYNVPTTTAVQTGRRGTGAVLAGVWY